MKNRTSIILLLPLLTGIAFAQARLDEKRSTIVEADGYAFLSEDKTIKEIREGSLTNAKRAALGDLRVEAYANTLLKVEDTLEESGILTRALEIVPVDAADVLEEDPLAAEFYEVRCRVRTRER